MKFLMIFWKVLSTLLLLLYPLWIHYGLTHLQIWQVAVGAALILSTKVLSTPPQKKVQRALYASPILLVFLAALFNAERFLWWYPVMMSAWMGFLISFSLKKKVTFVEQFARLKDPQLDEAGVLYCRKVTRIWSYFLLFNTLIALATVLYGNRLYWSVYNGVIFYFLFGALMSGEFIYRRFILGIK